MRAALDVILLALGYALGWACDIVARVAEWFEEQM